MKRQVAEYDRGKVTVVPLLPKQASVTNTSRTAAFLNRINLFFATSKYDPIHNTTTRILIPITLLTPFFLKGFTNFLVLIGYQTEAPPVVEANILAAETSEKEEVDLLPKRYRPENLSALCELTG